MKFLLFFAVFFTLFLVASKLFRLSGAAAKQANADQQNQHTPNRRSFTCASCGSRVPEAEVLVFKNQHYCCKEHLPEEV